METADYRRIEQTIRYLSRSYRDRPGLAQLARQAGLSPWHFQRLFSRWAGISPKRFVQYLTGSLACRMLRRSHGVLESAWDAGLSGPGRLHGLTVNLVAASPGEVKSGGRDLLIRYGVADSPFGPCLLAATPRGLCGLGFLGSGGETAELERLHGDWPNARWRMDRKLARDTAARIFAANASGRGELALHVPGTNFQLRLWEALLRIPPATVTSYSALGQTLDSPGAARGVGHAVAANRVGYLIPCHRVIRESGVLGEYRWGTDRKRALLAWEALHCLDRM